MSEEELERKLILQLSAQRIAHTSKGDATLLNAPIIARHLLPLIRKYTTQKCKEARIDELQHLTQWTIDDSGDEKYDVLYARHKRSYDDRIAELNGSGRE